MEKLEGFEHGDGDGDGDDYKEQYEAAMSLVSMKHENISAETAMALHRQKNNFLNEIRSVTRRRRRRINEHNTPNYSEQISNSSHDHSHPGTSLTLNIPIGRSFFPPPPPDTPECLKHLVGCWSLPFEKQLTESDVNVGQCRLSITKLSAQTAVLPLLKQEENVTKGVPVRVYDASGKEYSMKYKVWSSKLHVLINGWIDFKQDHGLRAPQDFVTLFVFRRIDTDDLCILITSRRLQAEARKKIKHN